MRQKQDIEDEVKKIVFNIIIYIPNNTHILKYSYFILAISVFTTNIKEKITIFS